MIRMHQDYDGNRFLKNYKSIFEDFKRLSEIYGKFGTLPLAEEKNKHWSFQIVFRI